MNSNDVLNAATINAAGLTLNGVQVVPDGTTTLPALAMTYDNTTSGLSANNVKEAIDELRNESLINPDTGTTRLEVVAGVLRKAANGTAVWNYINDSDHRPIGVDNPSATITAVGNNLTIDFGKTYSKVISFIAGPDETLAKTLNATIGASVGLASATLNMGISVEASGVVRNNAGSVQDLELGPFIVNASTVYSGGNATTTIDTIAPNSDDAITISAYTNNGAQSPYMPALKTYSDTDHTVNFVSALGSTLYTGAMGSGIAYGWTRSFSGVTPLDGTAGAAIENHLTSGSSNIWFIGIFEV